MWSLDKGAFQHLRHASKNFGFTVKDFKARLIKVGCAQAGPSKKVGVTK
jgi:hypothetical protein